MQDSQWNAQDEEHRRDLVYGRIGVGVGLVFALGSLVGSLVLYVAGQAVLAPTTRNEVGLRVLSSFAFSLSLLGYVTGRAAVERFLLAVRPHVFTLKQPFFWLSLVGVGVGVFLGGLAVEELMVRSSGGLPLLPIGLAVWFGLGVLRRLVAGQAPAKVVEHALIVPACVAGLFGIGPASDLAWQVGVPPVLSLALIVGVTLFLLAALVVVPNQHRQYRIFSTALRGAHTEAVEWVKAVGLEGTPLHKGVLIDADRLDEAEALEMPQLPGLDGHLALRRGDAELAVPFFTSGREAGIPSFGPELRARLTCGEHEGDLIEELADGAINRVSTGGMARWLGFDERVPGFASVAWLRACQGDLVEAESLLNRALEGRSDLQALRVTSAWPLAEVGRMLNHPAWRDWAEEGVTLGNCRHCARLLKPSPVEA